MGLFDKLRNIGKRIKRSLDGPSPTQTTQTQAPVEKEKTKVPAEYSAFPAFWGKCIYKSNKAEAKYIRYTMDYTGVTQDDIDKYIDTISFNGYVKATKVRYDKGNTYIIVEPNYDSLHLVFHIKK